jgi:uncharacterized protein (DUF697 family)
LGVVKALTAGVKAVQPVVGAVREAESVAEGRGHIAILPGDPAATRRLRELLGSPAPAPDEDALAILAATPGADLAAGAAALVRARSRHPDAALAVVIGTPEERHELERRLIEDHGLEASNVVHANALEGADAEAVIDRIIEMLGDAAVAAGRRTPGLRPAVGRRIVRSAARQAGGVGALPLGGAAMPVLTLQQIRMIGKLQTLHGRPMDADRVIAALGVLGAGFGWRALGRSAVNMVPVGGWAVSGGIAYGVTRGMGETALAQLASGHSLADVPVLDKVKPHLEKVLSRIGMGS